jgi:hypothetical protein
LIDNRVFSGVVRYIALKSKGPNLAGGDFRRILDLGATGELRGEPLDLLTVKIARCVRLLGSIGANVTFWDSGVVLR